MTPDTGDTVTESGEQRTTTGGGETSAGDGPGFTAAAALVAVGLAVGLHWRRR
ncbi:PGF-CTERM sorting domain-containing protein [Halapricum sp. CBA1109]|uniref:PGF-CTERM sorting domain-containing protein n=1 Tax=Halapricum sp. CBA1109 TaxID=2668068 RepID=UPI0018D1FE10|nr:PGF-CTERM sorting domain-containing protein [Halapricum sp. CBA1109]